MDLVYTDKNRIDQGVLISYDLDLDVAELKDFELKTYDFPLTEGQYWYIDGTEYGGVIDGFSRDTEADTTTYKGRNFRGILNSKIIEGDNNSAEGNITDEINELIEQCDLTDMFICENAEGEVDHDVSYSLPPYCTLYDGIMGIAQSINHNLVFVYSMIDKKVHITPTLAEDWSDYINYCKDNSINFVIATNNGINHLLLIGVDESGQRKAIHMFTDENGGVQPYATTDYPAEDSDYISDKSMQLIFGIYEYQQLEDMGAISPVTNYLQLTEKPTDWNDNCISYYMEKELEEDEEDEKISYVNVEWDQSDSYTLQTAKPSDWDNSCGNYYKKNLVTNEYESVSVETIVTGYKQITVKPSYWDLCYKDYMTRRWDGTKWNYESYGELSKNTYKKQTAKPTNWSKEYGNYYEIKKGKYVKVEGEGKKKNKAPTWRKNKYYTQYSTGYVPAYQKTNCWKELTKDQAPTWTTNTYYTKGKKLTAPNFVLGKYYRAAFDYYAPMIEKGLEYLSEQAATQKQNVTLDDFPVAIGDTVGGVDDDTGLVICEVVTNMIVKIEDGTPDIEYVVGGKNE